MRDEPFPVDRRRCHSVAMGIPVDAVEFFAELELNNDRAWWTANQDRWKRVVRDPLRRLCDDLADEFGDATIFRPYRDVRFSANKSPYKTHQGAVVLTSDGVGFYVQISALGLLTGGGWYRSARRSSTTTAALSWPPSQPSWRVRKCRWSASSSRPLREASTLVIRASSYSGTGPCWPASSTAFPIGWSPMRRPSA